MLQAQSLAGERGGRLLFRDLDFELKPGTLLRVSGPNGAGKTSLLRVLCALARPAAGRLLWDGEPVHARGEDYTRRLVWIGHQPGIQEALSARENLRFALRLMDLQPTEAALGEALAQLGLGARGELPARYLSQGQKRRAALARLALAAPLPLWILDEPLAALDTEAIATVVGLVAAHLARGGMAVLTTHQDVAIAAAVTLRVELGV